MRQPQDYRRRLLIAVTGLSPQIVTETLYALAVQQQPPFIPTEIRLITTEEGAERAKLSLLHPESGWFHRLRADYGLPAIAFAPEQINVLDDNGGQPLGDIRTPDDNTRAADAITEMVRALTRDNESALHVSIAGGRKTMGFYLGYALSLYGRVQDRLSHVLVSAPYESHPEFYYPTVKSRVIYTPPPHNRPYDTRDAKVTLAEIPFVRLRDELPEALLDGKVRFDDAVSAAQRAIGPTELVIDLPGRRLRAGDQVIGLSPLHLAFLAWIARRQVRGSEWLACPSQDAPDPHYAETFLAEYRAILGEMRDDERTHAPPAGRRWNDERVFLADEVEAAPEPSRTARATTRSPVSRRGRGQSVPAALRPRHRPGGDPYRSNRAERQPGPTGGNLAVRPVPEDEGVACPVDPGGSEDERRRRLPESWPST